MTTGLLWYAMRQVSWWHWCNISTHRTLLQRTDELYAWSTPKPGPGWSSVRPDKEVQIPTTPP